VAAQAITRRAGRLHGLIGQPSRAGAGDSQGPGGASGRAARPPRGVRRTLDCQTTPRGPHFVTWTDGTAARAASGVRGTAKLLRAAGAWARRRTEPPPRGVRRTLDCQTTPRGRHFGTATYRTAAARRPAYAELPNYSARPALCHVDVRNGRPGGVLRTLDCQTTPRGRHFVTWTCGTAAPAASVVRCAAKLPRAAPRPSALVAGGGAPLPPLPGGERRPPSVLRRPAHGDVGEVEAHLVE
jgi:hypothetical protein